MTDRSCSIFLAAASITIMLLCVPAQSHAVNPEPVGRIEIVSLTDFAGNASKLTSKIAPDLQALPFMGMIALTLNPAYQALDFSAPISVFIYPSASKLLWSAAVGCNGNLKLPSEVKLFGSNAFVKKVSSRAVLCHSKPLLDSILKLPSLQAPASDDNASSVLMTLDVVKYLNGCKDDYAEFKNKYIDSALLKNLELNYGKVSAEKMKQMVDETEKLIRQIARLSVAINLQPDYIDVKIAIDPVAGSDLAEFVSKQSQNKINLMPVVKNKAIAATVDMESASDVISRMPGMIAEFQNSPQLRTETKSLLSVIAASIDNEFSYYTDMENGRPVFYLKTESRTEKISFLRKTFDIDGICPFAEETYCIKPDNGENNPAIYCKFYYNTLAVLSGNIDEKRAAELFKESETTENLRMPEKADCMISMFMQHSKEPAPSTLTLDMKNNRININLRANPLLVKKFIPAALLAKSKQLQNISSPSN
ncbi:MAG: hypothetical protein ACYC4Q_07680 [Victivallaceae bacterium]